MRVLFPIGSFYPAQSGGPSNTMYWIAKELVKSKIDVKVITTNRGIEKSHNILLDEWEDNGYGEVIYLRTRFHYLPIKLLYTTFREMGNVDVIHLTALFHPMSWIIACTNKFFFKKKLIWSIRGELSKFALTFSNWKKKPIIYLIDKFLKNNVIFHATCESEVLRVKSVFGSDVKPVCVPNYFELPVNKSIKKINSFLYLGRLHPIKGIENFIKALNSSKQFIGSDFIFQIVGKGDINYTRKLEKMVIDCGISHKVKFLGHVEGKSKEILLAKAKFLILPSYSENFGNVVVEALAQKTPVIASLGTPWEILRIKKAGFWVSNDAGSLSQAINKIIGMSPREYSKMSQSAIDLAESAFDIKKNINKWIDIYKSKSK